MPLGTSLSVRVFGETLSFTGGEYLGLLGSLLIATTLVTLAWALASVVGTPSATFAQLGRRKWRWVAALVVLASMGDATAALVALYYLIRVRPRVNEATRVRRGPTT